MRTLPILLCLFLTTCSLANKGNDKPSDPKRQAPPPPSAELPAPEAERVEPSLVPVPETPELPPAVALDPVWSPPEESTRSWDESESLAEPEEIEKDLLDTLTAMYGVRLPRSNSRLNLQVAIGQSDWQMDFDHDRSGGPRSFVREVIISVSKNEIYLNNTRAVPLICSTSSGGPCADSFADERRDAVYRVDPEHLGKTGEDTYVIVSLLKLLEDVQRTRRAVLSGISDDAGAWLMDCDAYTLIADRAVPFSILAKVIHTAAYADLTRVRLVALDDNDQLTYLPILAPKLDHGQRKVSHLVGDAWWQQQQLKSDEPFGYAYLNYSASAYPETFGMVRETELPSCLPLSLSWPKLLEDPEYVRISRPRIVEYIETMRQERGELLGLSPAPDVPAGLSADHAHDLPELAVEKGASATEVAAVPAALDGYLASRMLLDNDPPALPDTVSGELASDAEPEAPEHGAEGISVRPFVFVGSDEYVVALRTPGGALSQAVSFSRSEPDKLYEYLQIAQGWALGVSAQASLSNEELVAALDTVRYRCAVHAMSGKCKRWDPVAPHVYLFMAPGNRFAPLAPSVAPLPDPEPAEPDNGAADTSADGPSTAPEADAQPAPAAASPAPSP